MAFPPLADELALHERVLAMDPVAPVDVFRALTDPLAKALKRDLPCTEDEAYDSSIDAVLAYLERPERYEPARGRLSTYLADIAGKRAIDRLRARTAGDSRQDRYALAVELRRSNPKEDMEVEVEAHELWRRVEEAVPSERDRRYLKLVLAGESSTAELAVALGITGLSALEQRRQVKRHSDRLKKVLERLGLRLGHDDDT